MKKALASSNQDMKGMSWDNKTNKKNVIYFYIFLIFGTHFKKILF